MPNPSSYRGYTFIYLYDEVLICTPSGKDVIDTAPSYRDATLLIDTWLNAP